MTTRWSAALVAGAVLAVAGGCGGESPADVSGAVTMDGQPLAEGDIIFEPAEGGKTPAGGPIRAGRYAVKVLPGPKKVRVNASRKPLKPDPVLGDAAREPAVAEEYNVRTTLAYDVKPGTNAGVDFEVKAVPRK